jgi:hypothetical protein
MLVYVCRDMVNVFRMLDEGQTGTATLDDLVNVVRKFNFDLDEDEVCIVSV